MSISSGRALSVEPAAAVRWLRDIYGNSIAVLTFADPSQKLQCLQAMWMWSFMTTTLSSASSSPAARPSRSSTAGTSRWSWFCTAFPATRTTARPCRIGCTTSTAPARSSAPSSF